MAIETRESSPESIIEAHRQLVDEAYELLLKENRHLKDTGRPPDPEILEAKRSLLERIAPEGERLRSLAEEFRPRDEALREKIGALQNRLMKLFYLDRENEQLLLKASVGQPVKVQQRRGGIHQLRSTYARNA